MCSLIHNIIDCWVDGLTVGCGLLIECILEN